MATTSGAALGAPGFDDRIGLAGPVRGACVLLIDGLGAELLDCFASDAPVLAGLRGRILQVGKPSEIYETPNCRFVADFIGSVNLFHGNVVVDAADHVEIETPECRHFVSHGISGTHGMPVSVGIRPEKIDVSFDEPPQAANKVSGEVIEMAYLGSTTVYHLRLATGMTLKATVMNHARHAQARPQWGAQVFASWADDAMVVLTQ